MPNSTSIKSIPQINLSSSTQTFEAGKFDNAFIKSMNIDIGLTSNPTSINIGLVNELGSYTDYGSAGRLNYLDSYILKPRGYFRYSLLFNKSKKLHFQYF